MHNNQSRKSPVPTSPAPRRGGLTREEEIEVIDPVEFPEASSVDLDLYAYSLDSRDDRQRTHLTAALTDSLTT